MVTNYLPRQQVMYNITENTSILKNVFFLESSGGIWRFLYFL